MESKKKTAEFLPLKMYSFTLNIKPLVRVSQYSGLMLLFFDLITATLAGGTNMGNIALWKYSPPLGKKKVDGEQKWKLQTPATVEGPVRQVVVS